MRAWERTSFGKLIEQNRIAIRGPWPLAFGRSFESDNKETRPGKKSAVFGDVENRRDKHEPKTLSEGEGEAGTERSFNAVTR